jgi:hydroxyethylthiazole kinase
MPARLATIAADRLRVIRDRRPRIHVVTNTVAQAFTANALLAIGAVPSMTTAADEIAAFVAGADGLLINLGTLEADRRKAIDLAIAAAAQAGIPWLLDPVFIDRSPSRAAFACDLAARGPAAIRGNAAEIAALGTGEAMAALAARLGTVVAQTGAKDQVTDGVRSLSVAHGHPLMAKVTAMGCAGAAITTAFLTCEGDRLDSVAAALTALGIAGEAAALQARGPGTFAAAYLDALHGLDAPELAARVRSGPPIREDSP